MASVRVRCESSASIKGIAQADRFGGGGVKGNELEDAAGDDGARARRGARNGARDRGGRGGGDGAARGGRVRGSRRLLRRRRAVGRRGRRAGDARLLRGLATALP